jgi:alpha-maltose-1-phosphate synthase
MSERAPSLVGVIGSGQIGRNPFDRRSWSGSSYFFFSELARQGGLHRAFGVEVPAAQRYLYMARHVHINRTVWRRRFYLDTAYRDALTEQIRHNIQPSDLGHDFLQIGALYDVPSLLKGRQACYSYHDGNLATSLRAPFGARGLDKSAIDKALAYERRVYHEIRLIFVMSDYLRNSFIRDFDIPPERVMTIGAGINLEKLPDPTPDKDYSRREILFIGAEFERKGGWQLLEAFRGVRQRLGDAVLHVVGPKELKVPPSLMSGVVYHGFLSKAEPTGAATLDKLFGQCSLFVMPSLYEPFGIAPLEAMAHEIPAVVTDDWALREFVIPGETGERVPVGNVEALEAALSALLDDPDRLQRMGKAARRSVIDYYTWDSVVRRLLAKIALDEAATHAVESTGGASG